MSLYAQRGVLKQFLRMQWKSAAVMGKKKAAGAL
jgi:hypothetical protein